MDAKKNQDAKHVELMNKIMSTSAPTSKTLGINTHNPLNIDVQKLALDVIYAEMNMDPVAAFADILDTVQQPERVNTIIEGKDLFTSSLADYNQRGEFLRLYQIQRDAELARNKAESLKKARAKEKAKRDAQRELEKPLKEKKIQEKKQEKKQARQQKRGGFGGKDEALAMANKQKIEALEMANKQKREATAAALRMEAADVQEMARKTLEEELDIINMRKLMNFDVDDDDDEQAAHVRPSIKMVLDFSNRKDTPLSPEERALFTKAFFHNGEQIYLRDPITQARLNINTQRPIVIRQAFLQRLVDATRIF